MVIHSTHPSWFFRFSGRYLADDWQIGDPVSSVSRVYGMLFYLAAVILAFRYCTPVFKPLRRQGLLFLFIPGAILILMRVFLFDVRFLFEEDFVLAGFSLFFGGELPEEIFAVFMLNYAAGIFRLSRKKCFTNS